MKYTTSFVLCAMSVAAVQASSADKKAAFDPMHLDFGFDVKQRALKRSVLEARKSQISVDTASVDAAAAPVDAAAAPVVAAAAPVVAPVDAAVDAAPSSTSSGERRLRGLSATVSFWDALGTMWEDTVSIFAPPAAETSIFNETENVFTSAPSEAPVEVPEATPAPSKKVKPVTKATKFFETKFFGGDEKAESQCKIAHDTYFEAHTYGVDACFLSFLTNGYDEPVYTKSVYVEALNSLNDDAKSYSVTTRQYKDDACQNEWNPETHKGYYPMVTTLSETCDEIKDEESYHKHEGFMKVSEVSVLWKLSHPPHREQAGHQMTISLYSRGRDCLVGQSDATGLVNSLTERVTYSWGTKQCFPSEDYGYFFKCLMNGAISIHRFDNFDCEGEEIGIDVLSREDMCNALWSGDYTTGHPVVQCGVGENWESSGIISDSDDAEEKLLELQKTA